MTRANLNLTTFNPLGKIKSENSRTIKYTFNVKSESWFASCLSKIFLYKKIQQFDPRLPNCSIFHTFHSYLEPLNMFSAFLTGLSLEQVFRLLPRYLGDCSEDVSTMSSCSLYTITMIYPTITSFLENSRK